MAVMMKVNRKHIAKYSYACNKKGKILGIFRQICCEIYLGTECDVADRWERPSFNPPAQQVKLKNL